VQVTAGLAKPDEGSIAYLSKEEIQNGYVLACQTAVNDNLEVVILPESRSEEEQILTTARERDQEAWSQIPSWRLYQIVA
jgi:uncharacterized 2Fe-2S/4Fe-4S cluster protein (DUF4445 family)